MFPHFQIPTTALRPFIQFYIQVERSRRDPLVILPIPARASPMIEFVFGDRFKFRYRGSPDEVTVPATSLVGMLTRPHATLLHQGTFQSFIIMFQVHGLTDLFGVPSSEVTNHTYDADAVLGKPIRELEQRLGNCKTFQQRVSVANHFFADRLKHPQAVDRMAFAADRILRSSGKLVQRGPGWASRDWRPPVPTRVFCALRCQPETVLTHRAIPECLGHQST